MGETMDYNVDTAGLVEPWRERKKSHYFEYVEATEKKRYRKKLIRLCSKKKLSPKQLEKIRYGITQNIDEKVLEILIDPLMEPERMEALIKIALAMKGE